MQPNAPRYTSSRFSGEIKATEHSPVDASEAFCFWQVGAGPVRGATHTIVECALSRASSSTPPNRVEVALALHQQTEIAAKHVAVADPALHGSAASSLLHCYANAFR